MTDLSLIILTWNTRELVLDSLAQLERELREKAPASGLQVDIWVVDNGSDDGTAAAIREAFPDVNLVALPSNLGYAAGNNAALSKAQGRLACLLNSDARISWEAIEHCVRVFDSMPQVGAAGLRLLHPDGRPQNSIHGFPGFWSELLPMVILEWLVPERFPSKRRAIREVREVPAVRGAVFFLRREVVEQVGMLPEEYFFFLEETDWCWQIQEAGWKVVYVPDAHAVHVLGASSKRVEPLRTRIEFHRSLYLFIRRHRGATEEVAVRFLRVFKTLVSALLLLFAAPLGSRFRGRLRERWGLLAWHLGGRPAAAGLSEGVVSELALDAEAQKRDSPAPESPKHSGPGGSS